MKASRFFVLSIVLLAIMIGFSMQAHAELDLIGQGTSAYGTYNLIYDTDLDITWYDFTRLYANWDNQMSWADALSVNFGDIDYDDWRLPIIYDGSCSGYCTNSEMGHLYYTELGNTAGEPLSYTSDFENLLSYWYWSGTESGSITAWYFSFEGGHQCANCYGKVSTLHAIAVMDGRAVVPEPISSTLFIVGGATLGLRRFWKKRRTT
jgi:hypothetical protein